MDDRLDITKLLTPGMMSIIAQNQMAAKPPAAPSADRQRRAAREGATPRR